MNWSWWCDPDLLFIETPWFRIVISCGARLIQNKNWTGYYFAWHRLDRDFARHFEQMNRTANPTYITPEIS